MTVLESTLAATVISSVQHESQVWATRRSPSGSYQNNGRYEGRRCDAGTESHQGRQS